MLYVRIKVCLLAFALFLSTIAVSQNRDTINISSLLDEMVHTDAVFKYPSHSYKTLQVSSYDRKSKSANEPFWFANADGSGYERLDTIESRVEKVMFEDNGPGVITRIWMTTTNKNGILRFYFDNEKQASIVIPAYDLFQFPAVLGDNLNLKHTNYRTSGRGGNTLFFPLPYQQACRVTFEEPSMSGKIPPRYYHINYRKYDRNVPIKTASLKDIGALSSKINAVNTLLANPYSKMDGIRELTKAKLNPGDSSVVIMSNGSQVIETMVVHVRSRMGDYAKMMQQVKLRMTFDGKRTVDLPLAYFSGAGHKANELKSWYLEADGKGTIVCRWPMPYQSNVKIEILNNFDYIVDSSIETYVKPIQWDKNTLYFHANWKSNEQLPISKKYDSSDNNHWNFVTLEGKGILRADLLSLFNHSPNWYGEGDEKIYVDGDKFPSHFGTGMEDYYNCSWAPVIPFHTAFGGAPTAENPSSHGYNSYYRARHLDAIPFTKSLVFDFELLSWSEGFADMTSTVFWYGDKNSKVVIN